MGFILREKSNYPLELISLMGMHCTFFAEETELLSIIRQASPSKGYVKIRNCHTVSSIKYHLEVKFG
jgi:hypothetical protein